MQTQAYADWTDQAHANLHILIADDHTALRKGVRQIVRAACPEAEIGEVTNGQETLEAVRNGPWNLLILDLSMPVRSGLEIVPALRQQAPHLRILVLTVHAERDYGLRLMKSGVSGYVTKDRSA